MPMRINPLNGQLIPVVEPVIAGGVNWRGEWDVATTYDQWDGVQHQGSSFVARQGSTGQEPPTSPPTTDPFWRLFAARGSGDMDSSTFDTNADAVVDAAETGKISKNAGTGGLGGQRAVLLGSDDRFAYASSDQSDHADRVVGITTGAASENDPSIVQTSGEMVEPSWSWTPGGVIYLGVNGLLTQTPPISGHCTVLGSALTATRMMITIRSSILLA